MEGDILNVVFFCSCQSIPVSEDVTPPPPRSISLQLPVKRWLSEPSRLHLVMNVACFLTGLAPFVFLVLLVAGPFLGTHLYKCLSMAMQLAAGLIRYFSSL